MPASKSKAIREMVRSICSSERSCITTQANTLRSTSVQKPVAAICFMGHHVRGEPSHPLFRYVLSPLGDAGWHQVLQAHLGFDVFVKGHFTAAGFLTCYLNIAIFIGTYYT